MRRLSWWVGIGFMISVVGLGGCGDPFGPPSRTAPSPTDEPQPKAKTIFLISPTVPTQETISLAMEGQTEANLNRAIFQLMGPRPGETAPHLAEIVKRAIDDDAAGLMIIPDDSPELGQVLADAESKGIAVVLIGRSIPAPAGSKPFTVIDYAPFEDSARKIVAATIDDLKKAGRPTQGTALVLADQSTDRTSSARVAALKAAASAAGFAKVIEVAIDGRKDADSKKIVLEAAKANPDLAIILTDDPETMIVASQVRQELKETNPIFIGGYVEFGVLRVQLPLSSLSCYAQGQYFLLARLGIRSILARLKGEPVKERVLLEPLVRRIEEQDRKDAADVPVATKPKAPPTTAPPSDKPSSNDALRKP